MFLKTFVALNDIFNKLDIVDFAIHKAGNYFEIDLDYNYKNWEFCKSIRNKYPNNITVNTKSDFFTILIKVGD